MPLSRAPWSVSTSAQLPSTGTAEGNGSRVSQDYITPAPTAVSSIQNEPLHSRATSPTISEFPVQDKKLGEGVYLTNALSAWLSVAAGFLLMFNCWGMVNSFGAFQAHYRSHALLSNTESQISWIGSIQAFLLLATTLPAGSLFDKGFCHSLVIFGTIFSSLGLFITSLASRYYQFVLTQGGLMGIAMGCLFIPAMSVISKHFTDKRKALAFSIAAAGSSLGGITYPLIFQLLEPRISFIWTIRAMSLIMLVTSSLALLMIRVPGRKEHTIESQDLANFVGLPDHHRPSPDQVPTIDFAAFKQKSFIAFAITCFFAFMALYTPFFYGTEYGATEVHTGSLTTYVLSIMNAGSVVGRVICGYLADRFGLHRTLLIAMTIASFLGYLWIVIHTTNVYLAYGALYGAFSGCFVCMHPTTVAHITVDKRMIGSRMGMNSFLAGLGLLIGQPLAGLIFKNLGWTGVQVFCGSGLVCATIAAVFTCWFTIREMKEKEMKQMEEKQPVTCGCSLVRQTESDRGKK